jgi:hypothetical protein
MYILLYLFLSVNINYGFIGKENLACPSDSKGGLLCKGNEKSLKTQF